MCRSELRLYCGCECIHISSHSCGTVLCYSVLRRHFATVFLSGCNRAGYLGFCPTTKRITYIFRPVITTNLPGFAAQFNNPIQSLRRRSDESHMFTTIPSRSRLKCIHFNPPSATTFISDS